MNSAVVQPSHPIPWSARLSGALGLAVMALTLAIMVLTERSLAIVWDEGYTLGRVARLRWWFQALRDPAAFAAHWQPPFEDLVPPNRYLPPRPAMMGTRERMFDPDVMDWFWPFAREEPDGHPPVYALLSLAGDWIVPTWDPLRRARMVPILIYSIAGGAIFAFVRSRWGTWAGALAAAAWTFQPHLFALAHYATYDGLLTSLWTCSILAFAKSVAGNDGASGRGPRWPWVGAFGILIGLAMGTKLTGWFLPLPFLAWAALYRNRRAGVALASGMLVAVVVLFFLSPPWWHDLPAGLARFLRSNLTRGETTPLKTLFLGEVYDTPTSSLPWYNTVAWTVLVTPVGFLLLGMIGAVRAVLRARTDPVGMLFFLHWSCLMILRALPHTPGHDAVRQFLPAFGVLALLVGLGAESVRRTLGGWGRALLVLAAGEAVISVAVMMPVPLSYFSPLVGGLPGAARLGMEPTFYWDALQPEVLDWLNDHTPPGQRVRFARYPTSWLYLRQTGRLRVAILPDEPGEWYWYVLQNRPGAFPELDRHLVAHGHPVKVYRKLGVPLVWVFPYAEVEEWRRRLPTQPR
jgi:4-amino-4-deoxy-L-arabinose transferase-like glycosyltransferase